MADIPGIIEGASEGKGLGLRFLRHIERNAILLFMVPADSDDITKEYEILLRELQQYNPELLDKQRVLAITKCDMLDEELIAEIRPTLPDVPAVFISSVANFGLEELKNVLWRELIDERNQIREIVHRDLDIATAPSDDDYDDDFDDDFDEDDNYDEYDFDE